MRSDMLEYIEPSSVNNYCSCVRKFWTFKPISFDQKNAISIKNYLSKWLALIDPAFSLIDWFLIQSMLYVEIYGIGIKSLVS